jgi:uncharacterized membrane protein
MLLLAGTALASAFALITASFALPEALRVALGVPMVLLLPGFALICVLFPGPRLSRSELLLASVGSSLAITTCACVLLGATPVGLARESLAMLLGGGTMALSVVAGAREHRLMQGHQSQRADSQGST